MVASAWNDRNLAAAHMQAAVLDLEAMGCVALEYRHADPSVHINGSRHAEKGALGRFCAADVNRDAKGSEEERKWFEQAGQYIAFNHGLSVTCGIYGYVENHSGSNMHLHIDDGPWSNVGDRRGVFKTPAAARPVLPAWPVRAFQRSKNLVMDGIPGPLTYKALQAAVGVAQTGKMTSNDWKAVQKKLGVVVDGVPGGITYGHLGLAIENHQI